MEILLPFQLLYTIASTEMYASDFLTNALIKRSLRIFFSITDQIHFGP